MDFKLIHQVVEQESDRIVMHHQVDADQEFLGDHFPGFAVLPGVMMLECLVQAGRKLLSGPSVPGSEPAAEGPWVLGEVRNLRYGAVVRPGATLRVEVTLRKRQSADAGQDGVAEFGGSVRLGENVAAQGRFTLVRARVLPRNPVAENA